jgi:hypothetical protein
MNANPKADVTARVAFDVEQIIWHCVSDHSSTGEVQPGKLKDNLPGCDQTLDLDPGLPAALLDSERALGVVAKILIRPRLAPLDRRQFGPALGKHS